MEWNAEAVEAFEPLLPRHGLHRYTVASLNEAIATLLGRGFAPRFLLEATVSRPQLKKGHLWLTLTDGEATVQAVIWSSQLRKLSFVPEDGDGVTVVGKLNFWTTRAALSVQILDVRPSLTAVMRRFEAVRARLAPEGFFDPDRKRPLPPWPSRIALLTSVPSSALADMLRTVSERWPLAALVVVPVPVQGAVEGRVCEVIGRLAAQADSLGLEALVLARGGGSREDLALFDGEDLARALAAFPRPVVCGLGHEDDTTIADLVADYRAATPLLPWWPCSPIRWRNGPPCCRCGAICARWWAGAFRPCAVSCSNNRPDWSPSTPAGGCKWNAGALPISVNC